jgi:uncharacterized protein (UPF0303 family)
MLKKKEWLEPVVKQEELLVFDKFDREDVLALGLRIIDLAKTRYGHGVAVRIVSEGATTFYHMMDGSSLENNWWINKKLNTCQKTGVSSMRAALEFEFGVRKPEEWTSNEGNYVLCGDCMPVRLKNGEIAGYALVSALPHEKDHQLLADAMAEYLGVKIPSII